MNEKPGQEAMAWLVKQKFIPEYFLQVKDRLKQLREKITESATETGGQKLMIGGGTDLVVQKALMVKKSTVQLLFDAGELQEIKLQDGQCFIGGAVTVTAFAESELMQDIFPDLEQYIKLISSTPIRNMATMAGNIVNASPIGDMSIFFLALDSELVLNENGTRRTIKLKDFYKGYKQIDKTIGETIEQIIFTPPQKGSFSFEKVCKRTHLDIASVNSACQVNMNPDRTINDIHLSAGGVAPFPKYLSATAAFLKGKKTDADVLKRAIEILNTEIAPISDARGTADYKRLLLRQLFLAHFKCSDELINEVIRG